MTRKHPYRDAGRLLAVLFAAAVMAAACGPARPVTAPDLAGFSRLQAKEVFATGFGRVSEKYLEPVLVDSFALEGLTGLSAIDPALAVSRAGKAVVLAVDGKVITRYPAPEEEDADGWASLTAELVAAARRISDDLRQASPEKVYEAVFDGSLSRLDVFSRYAGAKEARKNRAKREGFGGIGIRFRVKQGAVVLTQIMDETPAAAAGLKVEDRLVRVDGVSLEGAKTRDVVERLRGPSGTWVTVAVARMGVAGFLEFRIKRAHVVSTTVTDRTEGGVVILKVRSFNQDTARSLGAKLEEHHARLGKGLRGLILDLRGNPGGLLKQSVKVADLFLAQGRIVSTRGRHPNSVQYYDAGGRDLMQGLPIVVLVDGKSASAAEIVAAALQDRGRGVVIGTTSFGKGTVQTVIRLPNDGEITLTWSRIMAPSGYRLHGLGVRPTICTSGADAADPGLIAQAVAAKAKAARTLAAWRTPGLKDEQRRRGLRVSCPAERRRKDVELRLAQQLLEDQALYARALDLGATALAENVDEETPGAP